MPGPVIPIACAFILGLTLGQVLSYFPLLVLALLGLAILGERTLQKMEVTLPRTNLLFSVLLAGMVYTYLVTWHEPPNAVSRYIGQGKVTLTGFIDEPVVHYPDRSVVILKAQRITSDTRAEEVSGRVRLTGSGPFLGLYQYGDILEAKVTLRRPRGFLNPGLFNYGEYLRRQDILALASVSRPEDVAIIGQKPSGLLRQVYTWREKIRQAALNSMQGDPLAIYLAMIIGETGHLTHTLRDRFMASGTTHILSISGSHLGLVALVVFPLARLTILYLPQGWLLRLGLLCTPSQLSALITIFPVVFYALLAGGQVATVRSLIMILVYLVSVLIHRQHNLSNALALAAILVLLWDPRGIGEISFQLSYGSVLMMALAIEWHRQKKNGSGQDLDLLEPRGILHHPLLEKGQLYLVITLAAMLGTVPVVAYYFNQVGWVGIFSNLMVVPVAGMVIVPLGLFCAMASLISEQPSLPMAGLLQALYGLFYSAVRIFSEIPGAEWRIPSPGLFQIASLYILALAFLFRARLPKSRLILCLASGMLFLSVVVHPILTRATPSLRVTFLDVGQGDAAVLQFPNGQVMVMDGGRTFRDFDLGRMVVAPYLWDRGIRRIDYLVASHPQMDHIGGLVYLMEQFKIGEVWTNGIELDTGFYQRFRETIKTQRLSERRISRSEPSRSIGSCEVHFLNPDTLAPNQSNPKAGTSSRAENNRSIVLKIICGPFSYIFTGDIEREAERALSDLGSILNATVIKVPHHGSRGSIEPTFLKAVSPKVAAISAGAYNPYGHPAPEVLAAYEELGSTVFRTDQEGAILTQSDTEILTVRQFSDLVLTPVPWNRKMLYLEWKNFRKWLAPPASLMLDKGGGVK